MVSFGGAAQVCMVSTGLFAVMAYTSGGPESVPVWFVMAELPGSAGLFPVRI
jgi:hypothetical protein